MERKSVIEKPEYHGRGDKSTITYYNLIIPVILLRTVRGSSMARGSLTVRGFSSSFQQSRM